MVKVVDQNIPSELFDQYNKVLTPAYSNPTAPEKGIVQPNGGWRYPIPPSVAQLKVRQAFKDSCACWWKQKEEGTAWPPDIGPRDIQYWMMEALYFEMMIFHYYQSVTISPFYKDEQVDWCVYGPKRDVHVHESNPDTNYAEWEHIYCTSLFSFAKRRFFIMKEESEYEHNTLTIYCDQINTGGNWRNPTVAVWDIRQNFINELRITWNDQPYFYDMITYQTITAPGWYNIHVGTDWIASGIKLLQNQEERDDVRYNCAFCSTNYPLESLRPFFRTT